MEKDIFLPVREELRSKKMCGECAEELKTCLDIGKKRMTMNINIETGEIYGKDLVRGNIKNCVVFQAAKQKLN